MKSITQSLCTCCRLVCLAGTLVLAITAQPILAQDAPAKVSADYEAMGYVRMDSLNIILLYESKEGKNTEATKLFETMADELSGSTGIRFAQFSQASDKALRMEAKFALDYDLRDRKSALVSSRGYLLPVLATLGNYDPVSKLLAVRLTLDINGVSENRTAQCAILPQQGKRHLKACVSAKNMEHTDPIFHHIPAETAQVADRLKLLIGQGRMRIFAQAEPSGPYQNGRTVPVDLVNGADIAGNQPTNILALVLVDVDTAGVVMVSKAKALPPDKKQGANKDKDSVKATSEQPTEKSGAGGQPRKLGIGAYDPTAPLPAPLTEKSGAGGQHDKLEIGTSGPASPPKGPGGTKIIYGPPPDGPDLDTDKFLSLLSFTVYASPTKLNDARHDLENMEAKFERISNDEARLDLIQQMELKKLASKIERQVRKVELLKAMLEMKEAIPAQYGARLIDVSRQPKLNYERYKMRDGREAIVFRGTADLSDMETNFQLAVTPESLSELGTKLGRGQTVVDAMANRMQEQSNGESIGRPEAFKAADSMVAEIIRSGVKSSSILLTGHSLGGGLAQYAGMRNRVGNVVTFNPAPLSAQLQHETASAASTFNGALRHYVAFVPGPPGSGQGVMDPVSQRAGLSGFKALQVIGPQHVIEVCSDQQSPEYQSFFNTTQGVITNTTLGSLVSDKYKTVVKAGSVAGAVTGYETATTDKVSSAWTGMRSAGKGVKGFAAVASCVKHPFLCSAKATAGGLVSALASGYIPKIWDLYTAHRMKSMFDVLHGYSTSSCRANY